jgi:SAM-dependent methyltransferase
MSPLQAPSDQASDPNARIAREIRAVDDEDVMERSHRWKALVPQVVNGPNTRLGQDRFQSLMRECVEGGRVLEIGCGDGELSAELHAMGAHSVYGVDISPRYIERARARCAGLDGVRFGLHAAEAPIEGRFDAIVGRAILHHLDLRAVLVKLFQTNLLPGGRMVFLEPMSHPLTVAFYRLVRSAHTPDEWPLTPADVAWLRSRLAARVIPINFFSFPVGVVSSLGPLPAGNPLTRLADRLDRRLERRPRLIGRAREGIVVIDRPATERPPRLVGAVQRAT